MKLPPAFQYNQSNLQDFVECRRRFQLKHILHVAWPAIETEPVNDAERLMDLGAKFHHIIHQFSLGIPQEKLVASSADEQLIRWWEGFQKAISETGSLAEAWRTDVSRYHETTLSGSLKSTKLIAKFDMIAVFPDNRVQIYDWKTSQKLPKIRWLKERLQTRVYPYLLMQAGAIFSDGRTISPNQIEMIYWFATMPETTFRFPYSLEDYQDDERYLISLADSVFRLREDEFFLTSDENRCKYCVYRSLCDRGISAGSLEDFEQIMQEEEIQFDLDVDQIDEISY